MSLQFSCFITGTDTEVGKTLISCALLHALGAAGLQAVGMKPVAAGAEQVGAELLNEDVAALRAQASIDLPTALCAPYVFREACAPHWAAALEGARIQAGPILQAYQQLSASAQAVVVEGVGGFRVPLSDEFDTADLAVALQLDVILVVGLRLGCISHALLTAEVIAARGLRLVGWVANQIDPSMPHQAASIEALQARLSAPLLGVLPRMTHPSAAAAAERLQWSLLPAWPQGLSTETL